MKKLLPLLLFITNLVMGNDQIYSPIRSHHTITEIDKVTSNEAFILWASIIIILAIMIYFIKKK